MTNTNTIDCPSCRDGKIWKHADMSDYRAYGQVECPVCRGTGQVTGEALLQQAEAGRTAKHELQELRKRVAMYLDTSNGIDITGKYRGASRPTQDPKCWLGYLEEAARLAPLASN